MIPVSRVYRGKLQGAAAGVAKCLASLYRNMCPPQTAREAKKSKHGPSMQIRCPQCEYSRNIDEKKIPSTSEFATCPKCKHRFRFRVFEKPKAAAPVQSPAPERQPQSGPTQPTTARDIWDAVDDLHQRWKSEENTRPESLDRQATAAEQKKTDPDDSAGNPAAQPEAKPRQRIVLEQIDFDPDAPFVPPAPEQDARPKPEEAAETESRLSGRQAEDAANRTSPKQGDANARPTRDLGRLEDSPPWADEPVRDESLRMDGPEKTSASGVPWENLQVHGPVRGLLLTIQQVMLSPARLFGGITPKGSLVLPLIFYLLLTMFQLGLELAWLQSLHKMVGEQGHAVTQALPMLGVDNLPRLLLLGPAILALRQFFVAGFIHLMLLLVAPKQASFAISYKVTAYAMAPLILSLVPLYGTTIGGLWSLAAILIGCRYAHRLNWGKAMLAVIPFYLFSLWGMLYTIQKVFPGLGGL